MSGLVDFELDSDLPKSGELGSTEVVVYCYTQQATVTSMDAGGTESEVTFRCSEELAAFVNCWRNAHYGWKTDEKQTVIRKVRKMRLCGITFRMTNVYYSVFSVSEFAETVSRYILKSSLGVLASNERGGSDRFVARHGRANAGEIERRLSGLLSEGAPRRLKVDVVGSEELRQT